jgi:hypothetical protein
VADRIRQNGRFTILLLRTLDPAAAGARMPLPPVTPMAPADLWAAASLFNPRIYVQLLANSEKTEQHTR